MSDEVTVVQQSGLWKIFCWLGAIIAVCLSWTTNQSICWAIFHLLCGWRYNLYWVLAYTNIAEYIKQFMA